MKNNLNAVSLRLIVFFNAEGVIHREFVPEGQKVNAEFYVGVLIGY